MSQEPSEICYASGEIARVGDHIDDNGCGAVVIRVIITPEDMESTGASTPALVLEWDISLPVYRPVTSKVWNAAILKKRGD